MADDITGRWYRGSSIFHFLAARWLPETSQRVPVLTGNDVISRGLKTSGNQKVVGRSKIEFWARGWAAHNCVVCSNMLVQILLATIAGLVALLRARRLRRRHQTVVCEDENVEDLVVCLLISRLQREERHRVPLYVENVVIPTV